MTIAVVGCGDWGRNIARALKSLGALAALSDRAGALKASQCAEELKVPLHSLETILRERDIQGIVIATPPATHFSLAKQALEAGKHVFVEKPLVRHKEEALVLEKLAQEKERILMVGHLLRYHGAFEQLHTWVQEGKLGHVLHINTSRKNLGKIYPDEGVIWDLGPHDLSLILPLVGRDVSHVFATSGHYAVPLHPDEALLALRFKNSSLKAFITLSRLSPFKEQKVTVVGTKGMAVFDDTKEWAQKLVFFNNLITQETLSHFEIHHDRNGTPALLTPMEPLKAEMTHFLDCLKTQQSPRTHVQSAVHILEILEAADLSCKREEWVPCV